MDVRLLRRAAALALGAFVLSATAAFADTIPADGDSLLPGNQATIDLGSKAPGETVTRSVSFSLVCSGTTHTARNGTITIQASSLSKPLDGAISSTSTTIGPVPNTWPVNPASCPSPQPVLPANGPVTVTLTTPTTPGIDYQYSVIYARIGATGLTGSTIINFTVDVVANTPPSLSLPGPMTAEATSASGAAVLYTVGATDAEDNPDPTPTCTPASGATFPLGPTTVDCTVTDSGGLRASGSFSVTVSDSVAPSLSVPAGVTAEATSAAGAAVSYSASATDLVDPNPVVSCDTPSGSSFALGTTTVNCSATDASGNHSSDSFDVHVVDTTAPTLSLPADIAAEATGSSGAAVSFTATATDAVDSSPVVACSPSSGSAFPLGTTPVTCSASDASGNSSSGSFQVTVGDSAAPGLVLPGTITAEAAGPSGAAVTYAVTTSDAVDPAPVVGCAPASGSTFGLGTTTVACTATDATGNQSTGSFSVVVRDTTDPAMTGVPADISVTTTNPAGRAVSYASPSATDAVSGPVGVSCAPGSGGSFPVGTTTVTCRASDDAGNTASRTFRVTVALDAPTTTYDVQWTEPIGGGTLTANQSRTVPLKLRLVINGADRTTGTVVLSLTPCAGGPVELTEPLTYGGGRWSGHLDTGGLNPGCHTATLLVDGQAAGSFTLDLRGADPAPSSKPKDTKPKK